MKDLLCEIIILVEMKPQGITMRNQPMGTWCILRIYYSLESKWDYPFKLIKAVKKNTYHLQDMFLLKTSPIPIT
jgi:hypothetical protein